MNAPDNKTVIRPPKFAQVEDDEGFPQGATKEKPTSSAPPGFPFTWLSDAKLDFSEHALIKGLIDPGAFLLVYGPSGSGKSFFMADMAQCIATGTPWRGRRVRQALSVYVAAEAGASILRRFVGWRDNRLGDAIERVPLAILTRGPNLLASVELEKLITQLHRLQDESKLPLGMVNFDTVSRSMPGGDENKAEDMTMVVNAADVIREEFKSATGCVHHSGKDPNKGARGHSALFAAADVVIQVTDKVAVLEKVRDGVTGEQFPFSLEPVEIGTDADGDSITTCLLNTSDVGTKPTTRNPTGRNQKIVLPVLQQFAQEKANRSPGTNAIPKGVLMVSMAEAIDRIAPKFGSEEPAHRIRAKVKEALMGLQASKLIGVQGDIVWML